MPRWTVTLLALALFTFPGCMHPSAANIELRKQNADLRDQIANLNSRHDADAATIKGYESRSGATTTPASLPSDLLNQLFTVHGIQFGRLTGGADLDPSKTGDEGLKLYVVPIDRDGQPIKAAGSFTIDAFDLNANGLRVAHCEIPLDEARKNWYGHVMLYTYVLTCPFHTPPAHPDVTVKVTFTDALTGRIFEAQRVVKVAIGK